MRTEHIGGSYVDAVPSGEFAVLFYNSHMQTHNGRIELPPNDGPLYHRITTVGGFKIAGQAQASNSTLQWAAGEWGRLSSACGVSPVIYDLQGQIHISQCGPVGSQGYRYVAIDGRIWTGDETYSSTFGLSEWSFYGGLYIGQGHDGGGCRVWDGQTLRELEAGDCTFVRVQGDGDRVAVSFRKPDRAVIWQTTLAELRALLPVTAPEPEPPVPPDPEPEPPHPPDPEPEPPQPDIPPALPGEDIMQPTPAALQMGAFFARVDLTPNLAPWPGWFLVHFDRMDPSDAGCRFTLSQPLAGGRLKVTLDAVSGSLLSADAGEHGGGVCKQFYLKPTDDWGFNEQFSGWQLGSGGPEIVLVQYQGDGAGQLSACLKVVHL